MVDNSLKIEEFDGSRVDNVKANLEALGANKVEAVFGDFFLSTIKNLSEGETRI